jgi:hypothetical protein
MPNAAITIVYNESVNLPIWVKYYGGLFGYENLYVLDHGSDDGSTTGLGAVNVIKVPRKGFDEVEKTSILTSFQAGLTSAFDSVIVSDCDEIIAPDPARYRDLNDYIARMEGNYVNAIGIDILHIITEELPLDLSRPIMSQRSVGRFNAPACKNLLTKIPIKWLPGLHSSNMTPRFDIDLFNFHLKAIDYGIATARQAVNLGTKWSEASLKMGYGGHHRWPLSVFVRNAFLSPIDLLGRDKLEEFEFTKEVDALVNGTVVDAEGYYRVPMSLQKLVRFPSRFASVI